MIKDNLGSFSRQDTRRGDRVYLGNRLIGADAYNARKTHRQAAGVTVAGLELVKGNFQDGVGFNFEVTAMLADGVFEEVGCEIRNFDVREAAVRFPDGFEFASGLVANGKGVIAENFAAFPVAVFG